MKCKIILAWFLVLPFFLFAEGTLFVGIESDGVSTFYSDLSGFPNVNWTSNYACEVSGAAAAPDGTIYLIEGAFTTHLYTATLTSPPTQICTISEDMSALAYANGTLYGYSNYADPKGIYSIDTTTGAATLVLDVHTGTNFRFFALDYNPADNLFYGYTEYGTSGLYSINIATGEMLQLAGTIPASNGQGRGMAVGDNTVYLTATRGDDGIGYFAYDLAQGAGGSWVEFPNPYPNHHSTGGAAWISDQTPEIQIQGNVVGSDDPLTGMQGCDVFLTGNETYQTQTDINGDFLFEAVDGYNTYTLEVSFTGYETYSETIQTTDENIDLGTIELQEIAFPVTDVIAEINDDYTEVEISWNAPNPTEELESYKVYRFLEVNSIVPSFWELIVQDITETNFVDEDWIGLVPEFYQYAVVAVYTNGNESDAVLSNVLEKEEYFYPPYNLNIQFDPSWDHIFLSWEAPAAPGLNGFNVYLDGNLLGFTDETMWWIYDLINGQYYTVGIEAVYDNGVSDMVTVDFTFTGVEAGHELVPVQPEMTVFPNPFNPSTTISFNVTQTSSFATIEIYNLKGQKIKTFPNLQINKSSNQQI
ncbi:MAG: carboxypeptidase-like regulatory domain-containing protein, partial [Candidatus Cloacimonetes bacterium]|nr:carboxypeptidase-like regulatory domain-containing protein [Candidatus Cloacimonadota bacterium]MCF7868783.1 carboxypeptidase-like regulatory domain-containing protein [Candidatus Cloacimonadota bacterium]